MTIMSNYTPKNPETLTEFQDMLKEYNEIIGYELRFTDSYKYDIDVWCIEETTADGYGVWAIYQDGDSPQLNENVYYNEPDPSDLFNFIDQCYYGKDVITVYSEFQDYELEEYVMGELETNYHNYLQNLEDAK